MSYADEIRRRAEASPRAALPAVTAMLWRAYSDGQISEAEAEALSGLIEARHQPNARRPLGSPERGDQNAVRSGISPRDGAQPDVGLSDTADAKEYTARHTPQDRRSSPRRPGVGSRPRTDASLERRRRWAASGRLPPGLAARFTLAEQAVLSLVAAEHVRRKDCRLAIGHLAAITGVSETTVRNAIREARKLGLVTVEERQITGFRNDTNIVRVVSPEWTAWLRLARKGSSSWQHPAPRDHRHGDTHPSPAQGGGCKSAKGTPTQVLDPVDSGRVDPSKGCRRAADDPDRSARAGIRAGRATGRAMR